MKHKEIKLPLTIKVTAADIKKGLPRSASWCAIALAAKRAGIKVLGVAPDRIRNHRYLYKLPLVARRFIARFDDAIWDVKYKDALKPFEFTLRSKSLVPDHLRESDD